MKKFAILGIIGIMSLGSMSVQAQTQRITSEHSIDSVIDIVNGFVSDAKSKTNADPLETLNAAEELRLEVDNFYATYSTPDSLEYSNNSKELADSLDELDLILKSLRPEQASPKGTKWRYGDILYYGMGADNAAGETSFTGHTAVLSSQDNYVIEASKTSSSGNKVHHWNVDKLWDGASGIKQYYVGSKTGTEASDDDKAHAVIYGLEQYGEPYKLLTKLSDETEWYCSKLTHKQWDSAGYDLKSGAGIEIAGYGIVIPEQIRIDMNTHLYEDWGSTLPHAN